MDNRPRPAYAPAMTDWQDEIDARGLLCPLPVLRAARALRAMPPGAVLRLVATDPAAVVDVPHFCAGAGHAVLAEVPGEDGARIWLIRRGEGSQPASAARNRPA